MLIWIENSNILRITNSSINPYISTINWTIRYNLDFAEPCEVTRLTNIASNYSKIITLALFSFDLSRSI